MLNTWLFCVIIWLSYVDPVLGKTNTKHPAKPNQAWLWEMTVPTGAVSSLCALPVEADIREDHWLEWQDLYCLLGAAGWGCFCRDLMPCWEEHSHVSLTWQLSRTTINISLGLRVLDRKTLRWSLQCIQNSQAMKALAYSLIRWRRFPHLSFPQMTSLCQVDTKLTSTLCFKNNPIGKTWFFMQVAFE